MGDEDIRTKAENWLNKNVPRDKVITWDHPSFTPLTSLTKAGLTKQWESQQWVRPGHRHVVTSCNSFAGEYSRNVLGVYLGGISPHKTLKDLKKEHAWVDAATPNARPKKGDIVKEKGEHVFVSLRVHDQPGEDGKWETVMGGQGGPQYSPKEESQKDPKDDKEKPFWRLIGGLDSIKRIDKDSYDASKLEGWVDIELLKTDPDQPAPAPVPKQQTGTGTTGALWFNQDGDVAHPDAPTGGGGPGNFRSAGTLQGDPFGEDVPARGAPVMRSLDPLEVDKWQTETAAIA